LNIGLIGGGRACVQLVEFFRKLEGYDIGFVCDINPEAPGMVLARENGIPVSTEIADIENHPDIHLVFEITGNMQVYDTVLGHAAGDQVVIPARSARLIFDIIERHDSMTEALRESALTDEFNELNDTFSSALNIITGSRRELDDAIRKLRFININAKIEAVKVGTSGDAFTAVVHELGNVMEQINSTVVMIDEAFENVKDSLDRIEGARSRLLDKA
jgi:methyl-accepting chemotaxis protein